MPASLNGPEKLFKNIEKPLAENAPLYYVGLSL
jgi:hypothetical protein